MTDTDKLKNTMSIPLTEKDVGTILNNILQNQDIYLKQEFSDFYVEKLRSWVSYLSVLKSLLGVISLIQENESSLLELVEKGYIS